MEVGKARIQSYLVEAATQTFDPDELPLGDDRQLPKVGVSEAINIAKLKGGPAASAGAAGNHNDWFGSIPITREDWEQARDAIVYRLGRLREQMEDQERETGRCRSWGQALPVPAAAGSGGRLFLVAKGAGRDWPARLGHVKFAERAWRLQRLQMVEVGVDELQPAQARCLGHGAGCGGHLLARAATIKADVGFHSLLPRASHSLTHESERAI